MGDDERAVRKGPTIRTVGDPPTYFQVESTGTIHLVRVLADVSWGTRGPTHTSVTYWCGNMSDAARGGLSSNRPYDGRDCPRCVDAKTGPRSLSRWRRAPRRR